VERDRVQVPTIQRGSVREVQGERYVLIVTDTGSSQSIGKHSPLQLFLPFFHRVSVRERKVNLFGATLLNYRKRVISWYDGFHTVPIYVPTVYGVGLCLPALEILFRSHRPCARSARTEGRTTSKVALSIWSLKLSLQGSSKPVTTCEYSALRSP